MFKSILFAEAFLGGLSDAAASCVPHHKDTVNAMMMMTTSTPSKKPSQEAHSSPRSVTGLVLDEPEDCMRELESEVQPKTRMRELEEKRLALRRQCAHLQQQLHAFSARSCEDMKPQSETKPTSLRSALETSAREIKPKTETVTTPPYVVENNFWQDEQGNEATYSGPLNAQKVPHGAGGRMIYEDGSVVEGDFKDGKPHGEAEYRGSDGCTYKGRCFSFIYVRVCSHCFV